MTEQRTVIVTGAGTGIGAAIAARLQAKGWRVFSTMRRPDPALHGPDALALDVTSDDSVGAAVAEVMSRSGRVDAVVNNAGVDLLGAAEETSLSEAERLFQTNFFGVHRLNRAVLPIMRAQGHGHIVTVGSVADFLPLPSDAFYTASKHAVKGYTETLAFEVAPFGIKCVLVEPGRIKTELRSKKTEVAERLEAYATLRAKAGRSIDTFVNGGIPADKVAALIAHSLDAEQPKLCQRIGSDAHMVAFVRRFMPDALFRVALRRQF